MERRALIASAYHEAGHAVMAWCLGNPILEKGVAIDGRGSGHCNTRRRVSEGEILMSASRGDDFLWQKVRRAAQYDIAEFQAGGSAERRYLELGPLPEAEVVSTLATALRLVPGVDPPRDIFIVLRTLAELRLAETGRFAFGFDVWGEADNRALTATFRAVERGVSLTLSEASIWRAVEAVADQLLGERSLRAAEVHAIIERFEPPRLDRVTLILGG